MVIYLAAHRRRPSPSTTGRRRRPRRDFPNGIPGTGHAAVAVPGHGGGPDDGAAEVRHDEALAACSRRPSASPSRASWWRPRWPASSSTTSTTSRRTSRSRRSLCPGGLPIEAGATLKNPDLGGEPADDRRAAARTCSTAARSPTRSSPRWPRSGGVHHQGRPRGLQGHRARAGARPATAATTSCRRRRRSAASRSSRSCRSSTTSTCRRRRRFSPRYVHLVAEAMKRGFADYAAYRRRSRTSSTVPRRRCCSRRDYAKARAAEIDARRHHAEGRGRRSCQKHEPPSTTSLSVVDAQGNMVALTQTISDFFGAKVVVDGTGIILNNEMKNFSARGPTPWRPASGCAR